MESGPVVNGFLHWKVVVDDDWGLQKMIAFDPKSDEFKEIPLPEAKNRDGNVILGLGI